MGLFSSIKKGFKKIFKGIKKVFKKVLAGVGKILNSKWGKILMIGAAIFTGGMAIAGGIQGWAAAAAQPGATFMGNFVAGAKGFFTALANPVQQAKDMFGAAAEGANLVGQAGQQAAGELAAQTTQQAVGQDVATQAIQKAGEGVAQGTQTIQGPGGMGGIADIGGEVVQQAGQEVLEEGVKKGVEEGTLKFLDWDDAIADLRKEVRANQAS